MLTATHIINWSILAAYIICFSYQAVYMTAPFFKKPKPHLEEKPHKYGVLIAARNEEAVIGQLIESIHKQKYDQKLIDIFVIADNCTDGTAKIARENGAFVYERSDTSKVGKGYAMHYLLEQMQNERHVENYDAFLIFDADNLLDENYVAEMNRTFSDGYEAITSYRNSKNFSDNWISSGYALWFLHEAQFLNRGRMLTGNSCMVSGTGYLISRKMIEQMNGWNFYLLTEDIEFTAYCISRGEKIGYCEKAVFYDEQPVKFMESWHQRIRWIKGYFQVFQKYGKKLFRGLGNEGGFSCFDMLMSNLPAFFLTVFATSISLFMMVLGLITIHEASYTIYCLIMFFVKTMFAMFILGLYTVMTEWKQIHAPTFAKILYAITFPIYMTTYLPIAIAACGKKVEWKPVTHSRSMALGQINSDGMNSKAAYRGNYRVKSRAVKAPDAS